MEVQGHRRVTDLGTASKTGVAKPVTRSRGGCAQCKKRHFRCDESQPECRRCITRGVSCPGYQKPLRWSLKHLNDASRSYTKREPHGPDGAATSLPRHPNTPMGRTRAEQHHRSVSSARESLLSESTSETDLETFFRAGAMALDSQLSRSPTDDEIHDRDLAMDSPASVNEMLVCGQHGVNKTQEEPAQPGDLFLASSDGWSDYILTDAVNAAKDEGAQIAARFVPPSKEPHLSPHTVVPTREGGMSHLKEQAAGLAQGSDVSTVTPSEDRGCPPRQTLQDLMARSNPSPLLVRASGQTSVPIGVQGLQFPQESLLTTASLLHHYFSVICRINSCFDSHRNPFRTLLAETSAPSELLYDCALSMSAAHLGFLDPRMKFIALNHQTQAITSVKRAIAAKGFKVRSSGNHSSEPLQDLVVAVVMIGMSSPWHEISSLGTQHLYAARILFREWADQAQSSPGSLAPELICPNKRSFLIGAIAYWEMLASFVVDQHLDDLKYLTAVTNASGAASVESIYPHPWTGVSTPLFVILAKLGCLMRHSRAAERISIITNMESPQKALYESLLGQFRLIEHQLLDYVIPELEAIEDTADPQTTKHELRTAAQIYQLTGLLELYAQAPELLEGRTGDDARLVVQGEESRQPSSPPAFKSDSYKFGFRLAISILALISSIPISSGANLMLLVPLLSAGSRLQPCFSEITSNDDRMQFERTPLIASIVAIQSHQAVDEHWRQFVRDRIDSIHRTVNLERVQHAKRVMEVVWEEADARIQPSSQPKPRYWMDIVIDRRMETLFG